MSIEIHELTNLRVWEENGDKNMTTMTTLTVTRDPACAPGVIYPTGEWNAFRACTETIGAIVKNLRQAYEAGHAHQADLGPFGLRVTFPGHDFAAMERALRGVGEFAVTRPAVADLGHGHKFERSTERGYVRDYVAASCAPLRIGLRIGGCVYANVDISQYRESAEALVRCVEAAVEKHYEDRDERRGDAMEAEATQVGTWMRAAMQPYEAWIERLRGIDPRAGTSDSDIDYTVEEVEVLS